MVTVCRSAYRDISRSKKPSVIIGGDGHGNSRDNPQSAGNHNGDSVRHQISCTTGTFPVGTAVDEGIILDINYFLDYL